MSSRRKCVSPAAPLRSRVGEVAEWSKAAVLISADAQASVGSNPTLSAIDSAMADGRLP